MATADLVPKPGHDGTFHVEMKWGDAIDTPSGDDTGAVMEGYASITWLGALEAVEPEAAVATRAESALDSFFN